MITKASNQSCVLIITADGFEETETIIWLSTMRQAGICIKSIGLTSGLVSGAHGIWLRPDLAFADLDHWLNTWAISLVILPGGWRSLARLEADPRVHQLLRQVVVQRGQIVTGPEGLPIPRAALGGQEPGEVDKTLESAVLLRDPAKALEAFVQDLIWRLK